jgi:hypothetical protein
MTGADDIDWAIESRAMRVAPPINDNKRTRRTPKDALRYIQ